MCQNASYKHTKQLEFRFSFYRGDLQRQSHLSAVNSTAELANVCADVYVSRYTLEFTITARNAHTQSVGQNCSVVILLEKRPRYLHRF